MMILNGLRYLKYKKLVIWSMAFLDKERAYKNYAIGNIIGGIIFYIFNWVIYLISPDKDIYVYILAVGWPIFSMAFFYGYMKIKK